MNTFNVRDLEPVHRKMYKMYRTILRKTWAKSLGDRKFFEEEGEELILTIEEKLAAMRGEFAT